VAIFKKMNPIFQSERLLFREFTQDDAALIYQLNSDPQVVRYVHEEPVTDTHSARKNLGRILTQYNEYGYGRWAIHLKEDNAFIGWGGLKYRPDRKETDLGYRLMRPYWGKGYATEAAIAILTHGFTMLKLAEITAMAQIGNHASLHVLEKAGMQPVGFEQVDGCAVTTYRLINPSTDH
jgi:ribosomal-protein-alanine N-acetyltransferase